MCGIAGVFDLDNSNINLSRIKQMTDIISYRGPDGDGHWINGQQTLALGHRRLSIIDLSNMGSQPMHYMNRYTIVFNGEIYNYIELREELLKKGYTFHSTSDTEVLMALYHEKKQDCLQYLDGMFSFALWDNQDQTLFCARDRFGEKPFYYHHVNKKSFYFASEMKALWQIGVLKETNNRMLFNYWFFDTIVNPDNLKETFYKNIYCLEPSHYIKINNQGEVIEHKKYWDIDITVQNNEISFKDAREAFREMFFTSVSRRLRSDVPVGSSLSGGLDSSSVVAAIDEIKQKGVSQKTFSAKFPGSVKDESKYIDLVLNNVDAIGYSCFPDDEGFSKNIEDIIYHQEEPFGSPSIVAQYEVMKLAKQHNTVVLLDGQGADEILCGYHGLVDSFFYELKKTDKKKYNDEMRIYKDVHQSNKINSLTRRLRNNYVKNLFSNKQIDLLLGLKAHKSIMFDNEIKMDFFNEYKKEQFDKQYKFDSLNQALYYSSMKGGLQELLRYADRNSMAHSREVRLPFLSHKLVEFLFTLPSIYKVHNGFTKYVLRDAMSNILPEEIAWRKDKIGYEMVLKKLIIPGSVQEKLRMGMSNKLNNIIKVENISNAQNSKWIWKLLMHM
jgi:asparagine synthase (glutamine-hydrolysing)